MFSYVGPLPGDDTIHAYADTDGDGVMGPGEPDAIASKTWVLPPSTAGRIEGDGKVQPKHTPERHFKIQGVEMAGGALKGRIEFRDREPDPRYAVRSLTIEAVVVNGRAAAIFGTAEIEGTPGAFTFWVDVVDNGQPGRGHDTFGIRVSDGYDSGVAALTAGGIAVTP